MVIVTYFFRRNALFPHKAALSDKQRWIVYVYFPTDRTAHTTAFDRPIVNHWSEWKIAQTANASAMQKDSNLYSRVLHRLSYVPPPRNAVRSPSVSLKVYEFEPKLRQ